MIKKVLPIILALVVFAAAFILLQPAPSKTVVVAAYDLNAGHILTEADLQLKAMPADAIAADAITKIADAVGQSLRLDRGAGDILRLSNFGQIVTLQPNERAVAVQVTDASGLAGLLASGQKVGVVATISSQSYDSQGSFSKATIEGLRVLYIDPRFAANADTAVGAVPTPSSSSSLMAGVTTSQDRAAKGVVVLAVPIELQTVFYDFSSTGAVSEQRTLNAIELLAALGSTDGAQITLYLMPSEASNDFSSSGLWLPDLIITPAPTATPSPTPVK
jgi:pilus assembly protein CpaB